MTVLMSKHHFKRNPFFFVYGKLITIRSFAKSICLLNNYVRQGREQLQSLKHTLSGSRKKCEQV